MEKSNYFVTKNGETHKENLTRTQAIKEAKKILQDNPELGSLQVGIGQVNKGKFRLLPCHFYFEWKKQHMNYKCEKCNTLLWKKNPQIHLTLSFAVQPMVNDNGGNCVCPNCMSDSYLTDLQLDTFNPNLFYRLYDTQTGGYLASSYNAMGFKPWALEFTAYYTSDEENYFSDVLNNLPPEKVLGIAYEAGFLLEVCEYPFEMEAIDLYYLNQIPVTIVKEINWTPNDGIQLVLKNDAKWNCKNIVLENNIYLGNFYQ